MSSTVWEHFLRAENGATAKCKHCKKAIKCVGGSTSGLRSHLRTAHAISNVNKASDMRPSTSSSLADAFAIQNPTASPSTSQQQDIVKKDKITHYFTSENSTSLVISRMCALDGLAFRTFCTSKDIRAMLQNSGHKIPTSPNSIREIVLKTADQIKSNIRKELLELKRGGQKFSISFDEWTSISNKRFMNLNLHFLQLSKPRFINLGLIRICGSMVAEECIRLLKERLGDYNLSLDSDIVALVTDGCSLMQKVGKLLPCVHQVCLAHGVQLAILDVIYNSKNTSDVVSNLNLPMQQQTEPSESSDEENDETVLTGFEVESVPIARNQVHEIKNFRHVVDKVRKVVKLFKRSPLRNSMLQMYVTQEIGHELNLQADCRTRWSSLADMLTIFLKIRGPITKALVDIKSDITFTTDEIQHLQNLCSCLSLVKNTVEMICRRDATLLTADAAIQFTIKKLNDSSYELSHNLAAALLIRIGDRRLVEASLLSYLHNPGKYFDERNEGFERLNSNETLDKMMDILQRLNLQQDLDQTDKNDSDIDVGQEVEMADNAMQEATIKDEMEKAVRAMTSEGNVPTASATTNDLRRILQIEMALFDNGGLKGKYLTLIYNSLMTIVPTSVEAERAFSAAGILCTKIRASLSDRSLDALCFLRSYFKEKAKAVN